MDVIDSEGRSASTRAAIPHNQCSIKAEYTVFIDIYLSLFAATDAEICMYTFIIDRLTGIHLS